MMLLKKIFASLILLILCGYATWKGMETLSIITIALFLGILYVEKVKMIFELFISLGRQTQQAKIGNFELSVGNTFKKTILENINSDKDWVKSIISDLTPTHLGILLAINKANELKCHGSIKNTLRDLRDKGLINHNKNSITKADKVWLSDTGKELMDEITKPSQ